MIEDLSELTPEQRRKLAKIIQNPVTWAETFLVEPQTKAPFEANWVQKKIMSTKKKFTYICASRRVGKCVAGDTLVIHPTTLRPVPIASASSFNKTLCFDFDKNELIWADCEWFDSGKKKCLKLKLGTGNNISLSTDHNVFEAKKGWIKAEELRVGDYILAPTTIPVFGENVKTLDETRDLVSIVMDWKFIPDVVFSLTRECLRSFIRELWVEDGRIFREDKEVGFLLWNRLLAFDLQHLILRFGVESRVDEDGNLFIDNVIDQNQFLNLVGIETQILDVRGPRRWELITEMWHTGLQDVYDLSVEHEDHNFLGTNTVLHNSYALTVLALWHVLTEPNRDIAVFGASEAQLTEWFDVLDNWIGANPILQSIRSAVGNTKTPPTRTFTNGSKIKGYIVGPKIRGLSPDYIFVEEAQEINEDGWSVISPMMNGDKYRAPRIRNYIVGTVRIPAGLYYEKIFKNTLDPVAETKVFAPIDTNPDYSEEEIEQIRAVTPAYQFQTEYLLKFGDEETAVFRAADVERASEDDWEYGSHLVNTDLIRIMGIDWDKAQAGTNIVIFQYNQNTGEMVLIYREEVPRGDFTFHNACQLALDLAYEYQIDICISDGGMGQFQWEYLFIEGEKRGFPAHMFMKKQFNEVELVLNPMTGMEEKKMLKEFLVGQLQKKFQEGKVLFPNSDQELKEQLLTYRVVHRTEKYTRFSSNREHIVDCALFSMYGIWYLFENELDKRFVARNNFLHRISADEINVVNEPQIEGFWNQVETFRTEIPGAGVYRTELGGRDEFREIF